MPSPGQVRPTAMTGAFANNRTVHNDSTHADNNAVLDGGAMHNGTMPDRNAIANDDRTVVIGMKHHVVLHVAQSTHADWSHFRTHNGVEPDGTALSQGHITADGGVFCNIGRLLDIRTHSFEFDDHVNPPMPHDTIRNHGGAAHCAQLRGFSQAVKS